MSKTNAHIQSLINESYLWYKSKNTIRGLKALFKGADLGYLFGLPTLLADIVNQSESVKSKNTINILLHNVIPDDCYDHFRWIALLPMLLKNRDLNIHVVAVVKRADDIDTATKYRKVIDYIIARENKGEFRSEVVVGELDEVLANFSTGYFDIALNNIACHTDIFDEEKVNSVKHLIDNVDHYVISDFSPVSCLFKLSYYLCCGFKSNGSLRYNPYGIRFKKPLSAEFEHCSYWVEVVNDDSVSPSLDSLKVNCGLEPTLVTLMDEGNSLKHIVSTNDENTIEMFGAFSVSKQDQVARVSYKANTYSIKVDDIELVPFQSPESEDEEAINVVWGLSHYSKIINSLEEKIGERHE